MGECICYCLPNEGNFIIGSRYRWEYIIDGVHVYDDDGNQMYYNDYTFMRYFKKEYDKRAYNMDDKCKGCIRLDSKMKYKINTCPKCNEETYESYLEGRSYIRKCKHCGHGSLSFSYFGNCEGKRHMCEYVLDFSNVSKEGIVEFGGRYNIRVVTLLKLIRMNKVARLRCDISEVLDEEKFFDSIELGYVMDPPMQYSNFYTCKDSIRAKWLDSTVEVFFD